MSTFNGTTISLPDNAVWFVTGTSSGIGFSLITSILSQRSFRVVALSRNPKSIPLPPTSNDFNTLLQPVDLTSESSISAAFDAAIAKFGRIDVVVNNAGYGLLGELESTPIEAARELFEINYWAPVHITRHALRVMRSINPTNGPIGGVIAQVSSAGGYIATPGQSFYHSTKWALEGFTESVQKEIDPEWHIRMVVFEPGSVKTKWSNANQKTGIVQHEAYKRPEGKGLPMEAIRHMARSFEDKIGASADDVANVMVKVVTDEDGKWGGRDLLRLPLGADSYALISSDVKIMSESLQKWRGISESTQPGEVKDTLRSIGLLKD